MRGPFPGQTAERVQQSLRAQVGKRLHSRRVEGAGAGRARTLNPALNVLDFEAEEFGGTETGAEGDADLHPPTDRAFALRKFAALNERYAAHGNRRIPQGADRCPGGSARRASTATLELLNRLATGRSSAPSRSAPISMPIQPGRARRRSGIASWRASFRTTWPAEPRSARSRSETTARAPAVDRALSGGSRARRRCQAR